MPGDQENTLQDQDFTASGDPTSTKTEQMLQLIHFLASSYREISPSPTDSDKKIVVGRDLRQFSAWLEKAHTYFQEASERELTLTLASEWVLDNYYIIRQTLLQIEEDLPPGYYRQLPKLAGSPLIGLPRIYAICRAVLSFQNHLLNVNDLQSILVSLQQDVSLTMGELWAVAIFLRYSLVEALAHTLESIIRPQNIPNLPPLPPLQLSLVDPTTADQGASNESLASGTVANIILSLRTISEQNWNEFFEATSLLEEILRQDPAGIYPWMDFKTRDLYRKEIEKLSLASQRDENEIARITLGLARESSGEKTRPAGLYSGGHLPGSSTEGLITHVGDYLLGKGRFLLEHRIGYLPDGRTRLRRLIMQHASATYLTSIAALSLVILGGTALLTRSWEFYQSGSAFQRVSFIVLALALALCTLTISTSLVNWLITLRIKPRMLPKLSFDDGIPDSARTLVVIPALISGQREIDSLVRQLEMNFLRNQEQGLLFALLSDFPDADSESLPEDAEMLAYTAQAISDLNQKYARAIPDCDPVPGDDPDPLLDLQDSRATEVPTYPGLEESRLFYFLHRKRLWNPSENRWMGWERKRGKLHELNQLLRGSQETSFITIHGSAPGWPQLQCVKYVITLDADTILPRGAARRMVGTLAHPLNQAKFNDRTNDVVSGYTVLQPRMEIHPRSANYSWFTRIYAGDTGLDLYTLAVSDAYQDLFGEGSYVGKGIYDVDAFTRSVDDHIPENRILSHDLLEGIMGRAGLVTDITMVEDYPLNYYVQAKRQQRWTRGDWQLLPWLVTPGRFKVKFRSIDRWKMLDNLLRSLLAPALMLTFFLGVVALPQLVGFWIAVVLVTLGIPLFTSTARSAMQALAGTSFTASFRPLRYTIVRWLLAIAFLPYDAYNAMDAILTTLYRLIISHRNLLQWTTAAQTARLFGLQVYRTSTWLRMIASTLMAAAMVVIFQLVHRFGGAAGIAPALLIATPMLLLWIFSPLIDAQISLPIKRQPKPLRDDQIDLLRQVARRTWGFFERFVGPEDHWLPPDHFQESPVGIIAHRTSPTNIGLLFTSTLAAYDLGYLDQSGLATRLAITMEGLDQLERFRGHFLNWYDTLTLQPLRPRYISTIDSGNLAACLIITAQACLRMPKERIFRWILWQGYLDTLSNLTEILNGVRKGVFTRQVEEINTRIARMRTEILAVRSEPSRWYDLFQTANGTFWPDLSQRIISLVTDGRSAFNLDAIRMLQEAASQVGRHHQAIERTLSELVPWIQLLTQTPQLLARPEYDPQMSPLRNRLQYNPRLGQIHIQANAALPTLAALRERIEHPQLETDDPQEKRLALEWLDSMKNALTQASANASALLDQYSSCATRAEQFVADMDFKFLYHAGRRVFHNGFNLDTGQLDNNYYDILASEARIASIIALAKGEVSQSHWLQLSRPMTRVGGTMVLLSWSATMFEYLMPPLFLRSYPGTLLAESALGAVNFQIDYGKSKGVPWGISEAGFFLFDANQNYQYRAFGAPGLGFKRGLGDDLVISPYASMMAIGYDPQAVVQNLGELMKLNLFGLYGLYESIDFTTSRLPPGSKSTVVQEYMSHHQGMILMSLANYFYQDVMVQRMHSDPRVQSVELLLQEQVPHAAPLQNPHAEDVKGLARLTTAPVKVDPWSVPSQTAIPMVSLLSNGSYATLVSNMGGGYSTWRGTDLTRWQPDGVLDNWGSWVYIQDMNRPPDGTARHLFSAGLQPVPTAGADVQVTFFPHMAVLRRTEHEITSTMEVTVCADDPVEIRRIHLNNTSTQPNHLRLTSYGEVILTQQAHDRRHPAFNKLFIESEFLPELNLQLFWRRPRSSEDKPIFLGHMLVVNLEGRLHENQPLARHEANRYNFIGRGHSLRHPQALDSEQYLTGSSGATLDPIFALGQDLHLEAHENVSLAYLTIAGESREEVLALAHRYASWSLIERSFHQANMTAQAWLGKQNYDTRAYRDTLQVLSSLLYPFIPARASHEVIAKNRLGQSGLWRFGISGDFPILLVELAEPRQVDLVREVLQVHEFLRSRRFMVDVVILNQQRTDYGAELNGMLYRLVNRLNSEQWLTKRGGIFILYGDQITSEEYILLQTAAGSIFRGELGALDSQIPDYTAMTPRLPDLIPTRGADETHVEDPLPEIGPLKFYNGYGGFSQDGREYIIHVPAGHLPPAPWVNIIGYPYFGFMVSETGSQCTWAINSGENRLTPWSNDPVRDPTGEALYLRDEETGEFWSPTPLPAGDDQPYRVTHGAGYTIFEHHSHGLRQRLTLFASPEDPVKVIHLRVENTLSYNRRITATEYIEWVLGTTHATSLPFLIPEYDAGEYCLMVTNPYNAEFGQRTAFLISSKSVHGLTTERSEFLGRGGTLAAPAGLRRIGLETRLTPSEDMCAAMQLHLDLPPGGSEEIYFVLGQGNDRQHALELARKYHDSAYVGDALERTRVFWDHLLTTVQVHTPDPAADLMLNHWALYQSLSCRVWGRSAFYQPSGAFGFRDQLQDVLALPAIDSAIPRGQILNSAQFQFTEGDVTHWWHPPSGRGVRTRISDDLLWLPYAVSIYVETTGDWGILDEEIPFLDAPPLRQDENERYNEYPHTQGSFTLFEHCRRAIQKGATRGPHGLPLIGTGDWNDAFNRVGEEGQGESIWLGWFLCDVLERFARICDRRGEGMLAENLRLKAHEYAAAIESSAWDGAWYRRAFYDDGFPLGSTQNQECQIDSLAQSWSLISSAGEVDRARQAMQSVLERLVLPQDRLILLFTPPFNYSERDPGYIKGYLPGIRENGGQYTHAAIWTAWAFTVLGDGKQAGELFNLINPIYHADTQQKADEYRVEPYVVCADVYSRSPYNRRGGWTWYTGSAAWLHRFGLTALLGFNKTGTQLRIDPCIPPDWDSYEIEYKHRSASYRIQVANPGHVSRGVRSVKVDGVDCPDHIIPLLDDDQEHTVEVTLGE